MKRNIGFTLTEVLLAIAIVGIIAALVLPIIISNYIDESLDKAYQKEVTTINNSLTADSLVYFDTNYGSTDNMEKFMKKYFKISKYCGMDNGDCFASKYYQYADKDKVEYKPTYEGACASLKNGMSLCLTPTKGLIDVNGRKGPNIKGKDLREFPVAFDSYTRRISKNSADVYYDNYKIEDPCVDSYTEACCATRTITSYTPCCNWPDIKAKYKSICDDEPKKSNSGELGFDITCNLNWLVKTSGGLDVRCTVAPSYIIQSVGITGNVYATGISESHGEDSGDDSFWIGGTVPPDGQLYSSNYNLFTTSDFRINSVKGGLKLYKCSVTPAQGGQLINTKIEGSGESGTCSGSIYYEDLSKFDE